MISVADMAQRRRGRPVAAAPGGAQAQALVLACAAAAACGAAGAATFVCTEAMGISYLTVPPHVPCGAEARQLNALLGECHGDAKGAVAVTCGPTIQGKGVAVTNEDDCGASRAALNRAVSAYSRSDRHGPASFAARVKRTNANSILIYFKDGSKTRLSQVDYPLGHRRRRKEGIPLLIEKFDRNIARVYAEKQRNALREMCLDRKRLAAMPVNEFIDLTVR